jgi:hypothetical protein
MRKRITFREFESVNSFSNANIEGILRAYINESSNAALVSTFDDGVILLDAVEEKFYSANYSLDKEKLEFTVDNFVELELVEEDKIDFKIAVKDFFLNEDVSFGDLKAGYAELVEKPIKSIEKIIAEAIADKDFENYADFEELSYINEEFSDLHEEEFFKHYKERLTTNPLSDVLVFNWKDPVVFSLYESTESERYINSMGEEKAKNLFKNKEFRKTFLEACSVFVEDVYEGGEMIFDIFKENPSLFYLKENEMKEMLAKALITSPKLQENYRDILDGVQTFLKESPDIEDLKYFVLGEAIDIGDEDSDDDDFGDDDEGKEPKKSKKDDDDDDDGDKKKEEKPKELTAEDKEKIVSALKKVVEKSLDEKIKEMAQELLDKFDNDDEGTKPEEVKEAVRFLSVSF